MFHKVAGNDLDAVLRTDDGFELRPLALELLLAFDLFALGDLFELRVDLRPLGLLQFQLGEPALVVDRHGRAVRDRPLNVVDTDVVAKDGARVGVGLLDGRAGKADK